MRNPNRRIESRRPKGDEPFESGLSVFPSGTTSILFLRPLSAPDLFQKPGHVLAERLHRLNAFRVVFHFSGVSADPQVPVTGTRDDHLIDQEKIIHRTENMSGACTTDSNDGSP